MSGPLAPPNPSLPVSDQAVRSTGEDGEEIRHAVVAETTCARCRGVVELEAETEQWVEGDDGHLVHDEYGPGFGECCGLLYLQQPDGLVDVYEAPR